MRRLKRLSAGLVSIKDWKEPSNIIEELRINFYTTSRGFFC